jgi:hypothetical protein
MALETRLLAGRSRSHQRNQLPTTPDSKDHDHEDKKAKCEQFATRMRCRRKVKTIIRFARPPTEDCCTLSAQKAYVSMGAIVRLRIFPDPELSRYQEGPY